MATVECRRAGGCVMCRCVWMPLRREPRCRCPGPLPGPWGPTHEPAVHVQGTVGHDAPLFQKDVAVAFVQDPAAVV